MNRPDMERIKEELRIFERPTSANSKKMYEYILELEEELSEAKKTIHNSKYTASPKSCGDCKHNVFNSPACDICRNKEMFEPKDALKKTSPNN